MTKISIITPCFNSEAYIKNTYQSVSSQTLSDWEWLVVDDCSSDNTVRELEKISHQDSRVKVFKNEKNSGAAFTRNVGLNHAEGEYIAFLDADDEWFPEKLERQLAYMEATGCKLSCHSYFIVSETSKEHGKVDIKKTISKNDLMSFNPLATSFTMIHRSLMGKKRFDPALRRRQDWVFWFHLLQSGDVGQGIPVVLGRYKKTKNSLSSNKINMARIQWQMYRSHFNQNIIRAFISFCRYAWYGITKHYFSK